MDHLELVKAVIKEYYDKSAHPDWPRPDGWQYPLRDGFRCPIRSAGVYIFLDAGFDRVLYVGTSDQLHRRLNTEYFYDFAPQAHTGPIWGGFVTWEIKPAWMYLVAYERAQAHEALGLERYLVTELDPKQNKSGRLKERERTTSSWRWRMVGNARRAAGWKADIPLIRRKRVPFIAPTVEGWLTSGFRWSHKVRG